MQPQPVRSRLLEMDQALRPLVRQAVTPIVAIRPDCPPRQWGTGTLFKVADRPFLVTAAHVRQTAKAEGLDLHLFDGPPAGAGALADLVRAPLVGRIYYADDPADVAIFELADDVPRQLPNRRFLRLSETCLLPQPPGVCWVYGFPGETTEYIAGDATLAYEEMMLGVPFCQRDVALDNYDPVVHFLLDANRNTLVRGDGSSGDRFPQRLNGISGCSVWQAEWPGRGWSPDRVRIVGVQTSYYRGPSLIRATRWGAVAKLLHRARRDLRQVIEMHFGRVF